MSQYSHEKSSACDDRNKSIPKEHPMHRSWSLSTNKENDQFSWCNRDKTVTNFQKQIEDVQKVKQKINKLEISIQFLYI